MVSRLAEFILRSRGTRRLEGLAPQPPSTGRSARRGRGPDLPTAREVVLHAHFDAATTEHGRHGVRAHRPPGGGPAAAAARPAPLLVHRLPHPDHHQARHRPQHRPLHPGLRGAGPDPRAGHPPRRHLRVPVVHPPRPALRRRPRHGVRPRRRRRGPTPAGPDDDVEPGRAVPVPPPTQDPQSPGATQTTAPGVFEWTSPHGHRYRRDHTGTTALDPTTAVTDESGPRPRAHPAPAPTMTPPRTPPATR